MTRASARSSRRVSAAGGGFDFVRRHFSGHHSVYESVRHAGQGQRNGATPVPTHRAPTIAISDVTAPRRAGGLRPEVRPGMARRRTVVRRVSVAPSFKRTFIFPSFGNPELDPERAVAENWPAVRRPMPLARCDLPHRYTGSHCFTPGEFARAERLTRRESPVFELGPGAAAPGCWEANGTRHARCE